MFVEAVGLIFAEDLRSSIMKYRLFVAILIIFISSTLHCGKDETEDGDTSITRLSEISEILFGSEWNNAESLLADTSTTFTSTEDSMIFYQVKFDSALANWFMVKKIWARELGKSIDTFLTAVVLVPSGTKRICGELRRHDYAIIEHGVYTLSICYFNVADSSYDTASYKSGVNRTFTVVAP